MSAFAPSTGLFFGNKQQHAFQLHVRECALPTGGAPRRRPRGGAACIRASSVPLTVKASRSSPRRASTDTPSSSWRATNHTLVEAARNHGADAAVEMLRDMQEKGHVATQNFNQVVSILVGRGRMDDALSVALEAAERSMANMLTFRPLMKHCCAKGDGAMAKRVWRAMARYGVEGDMFLYAELMGALVRAHDLVSARKVVGALTAAGIRPHIVLYNTLLKGYAKKADVRMAFDLLDRLTASGVRPDETTFNTVLNTCVRAKNAKGLEMVMARMRKAGLKPGVTTFNTLLKWYARAETFDHAVAIFKEMQQSLEPSIVTYNTLIDGCAHRGDMEAAGEYFDQMIERGHEPDICTMTSLLKGFGRAREPERAVQLYMAMREGGFEIEERTRYAVINACLRSDDRVTAKQLLLDMLRTDGFVCRPRTFQWLMECEIADDAQDEVIETMSVMIKHDVRMDPSTKATFMNEMRQRGGFVHALAVADRLRTE